MSLFSQWLRHTFPFAYDPLKAQAARAASSTSVTAQAVGNQVLQVLAGAAVDAGQQVQSGSSAMAAGSSLIADLEAGANQLAAGYVAGLVDGLPVVGGFMAPEAKKVVLAGLQFGEQHLHTLIAGLFAHHNTVVSGLPETPPAAVTAAPGA